MSEKINEDVIREILEQSELKEKLDYRQVILYQLRICQMSTMLSENSFSIAVATLLNLIPLKDRDEEFEEELEKATYIERKRTGRYVGQGAFIREVVTEEKKYNWFKVLNAILNLFRRKGLLWEEVRKEYIE